MKEILDRTSLQLYAYYEKYIERIGKVPYTHEPKLKDLNLTRGAEQAAYREMKALKFTGSLVQYLCWVGSIHFWNDIWAKRLREEVGDKPDIETAIRYLNEELNRHPDLATASVRVFFQYWVPTRTIPSVVENYIRIIHGKGSKLSLPIFMNLALVCYHIRHVANGLNNGENPEESRVELEKLGLGKIFKHLKDYQ